MMKKKKKKKYQPLVGITSHEFSLPLRNPTNERGAREFGSTAHDVPAVALTVSNHIFFLFYLSIPLEEEEEKNSHPHHLEGIHKKTLNKK
jgi:hypothetical protein